MGTTPQAHPARSESVRPADVLFGRVRQRVLGLLFGHPERSYYANEIIGWVGSGSGGVQRELSRLDAAGLVTVTRVGRQKHYQANARAPVFQELRGIVLKTVGMGDVLRAALASLERDIRAAFVFGSVAKGGDRAGSDVDLMVISDRLTYPDLVVALETGSAQLARAVNPTLYTSAELGRRIRERNAFILKVMEQPKIWIIGGEDDLST